MNPPIDNSESPLVVSPQPSNNEAPDSSIPSQEVGRLYGSDPDSSSSDGLTCFVVMPFGSGNEYARGNKESDYVFQHIICPALTHFSEEIKRPIKTFREVDSGQPGSITRAILHRLASSDICIVDITGRNPNVFLELGVRYGLRPRTTILLRQESTPIPFDISGFRCLTYDCFEPDCAVVAIAESLLSAFKNPASVDSLVFEVFSDLRLIIPGIVDTAASSSVQSWDEWWAGVGKVLKLLEPASHNGYFVPKAVLGISNGGLIAADIITRELYRGTPLVSLWQNRWRKDKDIGDASYFYFDNAVNSGVVEALRQISPTDGGPFLLVDDVIYRGTTSLQAVCFLERNLKPCDLLISPIFVRDTSYLEPLLPYLPPGYKGGSVFNISKEQYFSLISTPKSFPYKRF